MWNPFKKVHREAVRETVRVRYPHPGQRFVDVDELLANPGAKKQIERMADLAQEIPASDAKKAAAG